MIWYAALVLFVYHFSYPKFITEKIALKKDWTIIWNMTPRMYEKLHIG